MSTKYYLQKVPVEAVEPGYSLAIRNSGNYRLFQVKRAETSQRSGQPATVRLTSVAGTPVVWLFGICEAAAS
jgi:hypothetical protein